MPEAAQPTTPATPQEGAEQTPPWGDDFDPARAWKKIQEVNREAAGLRDRLKEAEPIVTQWKALEDASRTDLERQQQETARWQEDAQKWRGTAVQSRVQALAGDFADPTDAASVAADPSKYLGADGQINDEAIKSDLAALLEQKPHWRRVDGGRTPAPNQSQGRSGASVSTDPAQQFASILQGLK